MKFMKHRMLVNHDQSVCIVYTQSHVVAKNIFYQLLCLLSSYKNYNVSLTVESRQVLV